MEACHQQHPTRSSCALKSGPAGHNAALLLDLLAGAPDTQGLVFQLLSSLLLPPVQTRYAMSSWQLMATNTSSHSHTWSGQVRSSVTQATAQQQQQQHTTSRSTARRTISRQYHIASCQTNATLACMLALAFSCLVCRHATPACPSVELDLRVDSKSLHPLASSA
jgi:hypothetical protein